MIIVTGGSGKVGRACVRDLMEHGYKVLSIDLMRPAGHFESAQADRPGVQSRRHHGFRPGDGGVLRHRRPARRREGHRHRPYGRHRGARPRGGPRHLRRQHEVDLQCVRGGAAARHPQCRVGVERDGVRHPLSRQRGSMCRSTKRSRRRSRATR